jgi:hypothetical protein
MIKSARVRVMVDFTGKERPGGYNVRITPEEGDAVGAFGGSGNVDANNQIAFEEVPPGMYVLGAAKPIYRRPADQASDD